MRALLGVSFSGLILLGMLIAVWWTAPARSGVEASLPGDRGDRAAVGKIVREYIIANPEVLLEAMQELEKKQDAQRESGARKAIRTYQSELLRDGDSPVGGNPDGDVTIVEFNDYQCPYCKQAFPVVEAVAQADGKVKLVYKDLPILGETSRIAALAALASQKQGKHDGFHKALMQFKGRLDGARILELAATVGIDVRQLEADMRDPKLQQIIERNIALAAALGVRGTPAFIIGDQFVPGVVDADTLKKLIAEARDSRGRAKQ